MAKATNKIDRMAVMTPDQTFLRMLLKSLFGAPFLFVFLAFPINVFSSAGSKENNYSEISGDKPKEGGFGVVVRIKNGEGKTLVKKP